MIPWYSLTLWFSLAFFVKKRSGMGKSPCCNAQSGARRVQAANLNRHRKKTATFLSNKKALIRIATEWTDVGVELFHQEGQLILNFGHSVFVLLNIILQKLDRNLTLHRHAVHGTKIHHCIELGFIGISPPCSTAFWKTKTTKCHGRNQPTFWRFMGANLADLATVARQMAMASMPCTIGDLD